MLHNKTSSDEKPPAEISNLNKGSNVPSSSNMLYQQDDLDSISSQIISNGCKPSSAKMKSDSVEGAKERSSAITLSACSTSSVISSSNTVHSASSSKDMNCINSSPNKNLSSATKADTDISSIKTKDETIASSALVMGNKDIPIIKASKDHKEKESWRIALDRYKQSWGIPLDCRLLGGGEDALNSTNQPANNWQSGNAAGMAAPGSNANNNNNATGNTSVPNASAQGSGWTNNPQSPTRQPGTAAAWPAGNNAAGNNSSGRQMSGNMQSPNASHQQSNAPQVINKGSSAGQNMGPSPTNQPQQSSNPNVGSGPATSWAQAAAGKNMSPSGSTNASVNNNSSGAVSPNSANCGNGGSVGNNGVSGTVSNGGGGSGCGNNGTPNGSSAASSSGSDGSTSNTSGNTNSTAKQQIEQLNSMREALFSHDGWGGQHVNQDSGWDVPQSPEPAPGKDGVPTVPWKPNVNNGTELWEANLRNGGQPPPQTTQKTPWGHTPTTNIGGTWGEDDDVSESSSVWNTNQNNSNPMQQWGSSNGNQSSMWGSKKDEWSSSGGNWNDPRDMSRSGGSMDPRSGIVDMSHMRTMMDHRMGGDNMMRGDPRTMTNRLNGSSVSDSLWGGPPPQQPGPHHHVNPNGPPPGPTSKLMQQGPSCVTNKTNWKEMPGVNTGLSRGGIPPGGVMPQNRIGGSGTGASVGGIKSEQPLWGHPNSCDSVYRNGSWGDAGAHDMNVSSWGGGEDKISSWNDPGLPNWGNVQKPKTPMTPAGWVDGEVDPSAWSHQAKMGAKNLTKDIIWASKQFRILSEMNFKKEDVESALRASNMVLEDALEYLSATRCTTGGADGWRRHDSEPNPFDHTGVQGFPSHRFNSQHQLPFGLPPGGNGNGSGVSNMGNINPSLMGKMMQQPPIPQTSLQQTFPQNSRTPANPTTQQLRMLLQQIQMAVQAGYLNHQILNQPLAPQTLILVNQLLQHIKFMQQLASQQQIYSQPPVNPKNNSALISVTGQMTKTKAQITSLQNQIATQQTLYMKQQQQQHMNPLVQQQNADYLKTQESLGFIQNFGDMSLNKDSQMHGTFQNQQSRLNSQWKIPSMEKEDTTGSNEFSRAPGSTAKAGPSPSSPNLNPLLGQGDRCESAWGDNVQEVQENKEWTANTSSISTPCFTADLVPEFEPGKPWKGGQIKNIEDDPNITPGSVVHSPFSVARIREADILNVAAPNSGKTSPPNTSDLPLPISSSTWSFSAPTSGSTSFTSPVSGKLNNGGGKGSWSDVTTAAGNTDLWTGSKSRGGPPPGLTTSKSSGQLPVGATNSPNGSWGQVASPRWPTAPGTQSSWPSSPSLSSWLLLKNLTPQIDGSTLKTLCVQHGPLQSFHLFLGNGMAFAKYCSRDEAAKAQAALNNCVLGNTTIFVESPGEADVHIMLQQLNSQQQGSGNNWGQVPGGNQNKRLQGTASGIVTPAPDAWGSASVNANALWPSALWSNPQAGLDNPDPHRATPSNLNSYLPGDLLGGESM